MEYSMGMPKGQAQMGGGMGAGLTLGCRLYFLLALGGAPVVETSPCFGALLSVAESSLRYEPSTLPALLSAMGRGRPEDCPRDSAIARWSFW